MPRSLTRRDFLWLTGACLAGWGGLAYIQHTGSVPSSAPEAEATPAPPWWPPPGPVSVAAPISTQGGRVLAIRGNDLIINSGNHEVALEVSSKTVNCDGSWVCEMRSVEVGDYVSVTGQVAGFDRFYVDNLWVNITNLLGEVIAVPDSPVPPFTLVMSDRYDDRRPESEKPHRVLIDPRTWWAPVLKGRFEAVGNEALPIVAGGFIGIVGRVEDGIVLAASIYDLRGKQ